MNAHQSIARAVARNPIAAALERIGDTDISVSLTITPMQYQERTENTGGSFTQSTRRWMIPARALAASGFPLPPREGDLLTIADPSEQIRIDLVSAGYADGEIVRWDVSGTGGVA